MKYLIERLKEPSTWRGLVMVATSAGIGIAPAAAEAIITAGVGLAGLIGVLTKDQQ